MKHWRWILTLLFGLLVALASAQTFQRSLPFLGKPSSGSTHLSPTQIPGIVSWYNATNAPYGVQVTTWTDSILGYALTNTASGLSANYRPTNSTDGLCFDANGGKWLAPDHPAYDYGSNVTLFVITTPFFRTISAGQQIIVSGNSASCSLFFEEASQKLHWYSTGIGADVLFPSGETIKTNRTYDIAVVRSGTNINIFLDGVWATNSTTTQTAYLPEWVGGSIVYGKYFDGMISDIILYTNAISTNNVADLHWYCTNTVPVGTASLVADWDVDKLALNVGDLVTNLVDQSANAYHLRGTGSQRPYYTNNASVISGKSFLVFDGVGNYLRTNYASLNQPVTVYMVTKLLQNAGGAQVFFDSAVTTGYFEMYDGGSQYILYAGLYAGGAVDVTPRWEILTTIYNKTASYFKTNTVIWCRPLDAGTGSQYGMTLGCAPNNSSFGPISVARVLVYSEVHNRYQQAYVVQQLKALYGL